MASEVDSTHSGWLKKQKGDGALMRFVSNAQWRYYILDYRSKTLLYSHSEFQKNVSQPLHFSELVSAELLRANDGSGLLLRTRGRTFTLYAPDEMQAARWVYALNVAIDQSRNSPAAAGVQVGGLPARPKANPEPAGAPKRCAMVDPRSPGGMVSVLGFSQPGGEGPWDATSGRGLLGTYVDMGPAALSLAAPAMPGVQHAFNNAEAAFQALKVWHKAQHFQTVSAAAALSIKHEWRAEEDGKYCGYNNAWQAMLAVQRAKFAPNTAAAASLQATADAFLLAHCIAEGRDNTWSDNSNGEGMNWLGMQLMLIRDELNMRDAWSLFITRECGVNIHTGRMQAAGGESPWRAAVRRANSSLREAFPLTAGVARVDLEKEQSYIPFAPPPVTLHSGNSSAAAPNGNGGFMPRASAAMSEEQCKAALKMVSCEVRSQAAARCPNWQELSWKDRYAAALACSNGTNNSSNHSTDGLRQRHRTGHVMSAPAANGQATLMQPLERPVSLEHNRLRAIFDASDSLQVLFGHHTDKLVSRVILEMRSQWVQKGEVVSQQGCTSDTLFVVDEGIFDVMVQTKDPYGRMNGSASRICQHGPGTVFGEKALVSTLPRTATVQAATRARVWTLNRSAFQSLLRMPDGTKTIGLLGGIMLLSNNLAGPTIVSMPALAQEAGWFSLILVQLVVASLACACGLMLIEAMRRMPGNRTFDQRIEFANLAMFYLPHPIYTVVMLCYHLNSILSLMSLIIQSGQCIDFLLLNAYGCAPGLQLDLPGVTYVCGTITSSATPFGEAWVLSSSMAIVGVICAPFALMNLDDNVGLQFLAIVGLVMMSCVWVWLLVNTADFPTTLPVVTASQSGLVGTVLFNFAFASTLPSWVNEKRPEVPIKSSFILSCGFVVVVYSIVGIVGGMAYKPFFMTDENLFSKLNANGSKLGQATVIAYPMLQNFTSIPVFSILIRYNLIQSGFSRTAATMIAMVLPWMLSIPCYTGRGFDTIAELGGLATSSVINFLAPTIMYLMSRQDWLLRLKLAMRQLLSDRPSSVH